MTHRCSEGRVNPENFKSRLGRAIASTPDVRLLFEGNLPLGPPSCVNLKKSDEGDPHLWKTGAPRPENYACKDAVYTA